MKSVRHQPTMRSKFAVRRCVLACLAIMALAIFVIVTPNSITKAQEQQPSKDSASKDSASDSLRRSKAETKLKTPANGTNGMSTSSMEYEPMYPADKPNWIFKDPYWNNDETAFIVHVSGDLEVSEEACNDRRFEGSIDAFCDDLDKYVFKQSPSCKQIPEVVEDLRKILESTKLDGRFIRENGDERFKIEGTVLEVNTAEGKRYQLWRKIEISKGYLTRWQFFHNRAYHPERFRNVGVGLLSVLGVLGLAHVGVRTLGRKKTGNHTFLTTNYR